MDHWRLIFNSQPIEEDFGSNRFAEINNAASHHGADH